MEGPRKERIAAEKLARRNARLARDREIWQLIKEGKSHRFIANKYKLSVNYVHIISQVERWRENRND